MKRRWNRRWDAARAEEGQSRGHMTRRAFAIFIGLMVVVGIALAQVPGVFATLTADSLSCTTAGCALTNVPTAPTAAPGTDTTQLATTAFVASAVSSRVAQAVLVTNGSQANTICTTGTSAFSQCSGTAAVTWPTAFADANYSVTCLGAGAMTGTVTQVWATNITASGFTLNLQNGDSNGAVASTFAQIDCIGVHP